MALTRVSNRSQLQSLAVAALAALTALAGPMPGAWAAGGAVYRCPGTVLTYTDQLTPQQARERGCMTIEGGPVTIVQGNKPRPASGVKPVTTVTNASTVAKPANGAASSTVASASRPADSKVNDREQRERDADARRILEAELRREETKLAELKKDFNNGEPERQGNERNYQRYLDRVEEMKQSIARKEADLAAIRRELGRTRAPE